MSIVYVELQVDIRTELAQHQWLYAWEWIALDVSNTWFVMESVLRCVVQMLQSMMVNVTTPTLPPTPKEHHQRQLDKKLIDMNRNGNYATRGIMYVYVRQFYGVFQRVYKKLNLKHVLK